MSMTDPVADFLTHIRNATMRKHASVESPSSTFKVAIATVLKKEGFIQEWEVFKSERGHARIRVELKYSEMGDSVIRGIQRVSRPGLRRHMGFEALEPVLNGQGIAIVSTSKGVMSDYDCRKLRVGGEVLCQVW